MRKKTQVKNPALLVASIYIGFVLFRYLLATTTSAYPMVNIDEFLYFGMARSMANGQGLMFRGQPATYSYILYSLCLVPVYLTGLTGVTLFRVLQLWNIMLVSLAIFPIYQLGCRFLKDKGLAVLVSLFAMLLPDFMIGQLMMQENIIIPMFFALMLAAYEYSEHGRWRDIIWVGVLGGLLFSTKPGAIAPAAVMLLAWMILGVKDRSRTRILQVLAALGILAAVAGFFFLLVWLMGGQASVLSIYEVQVSDAQHLDLFFRFLGIYPAYFAMACGIGALVLAFVRFRVYSPTQRFLFVTLMVSLAVTIAGVAWSVNRYEFQATTAHMRYIGMYIPALLLFLAVRPEEPDRRLASRTRPAAEEKVSPGGLIAATVLTALVPVLLGICGVYGGVSRQAVYAENMTLASVLQGVRMSVPDWVMIAIALALGAVFLVMLWAKSPRAAQTTAAVLLGVAMLVNNVAAYALCTQDTRFDFIAQGDAMQAQLGEDSPLFVYSRITTTAYYGPLDVYNNKGVSFVSINDFFNHFYADGGVYKPFRPKASRGQRAAEDGYALLETPDTNAIVVDPTVYAVMIPAEDNTTHWTANRNGLHLIRIKDREKRWLDSAIGGTENAVLSKGKKGILLVMNEERLTSPLTIRMQLKCDAETEMRVFSSRESVTLNLKAGQDKYDFVFEKPEDAYNIECNGDIHFQGYELINP
ncbi:MAG: glycosyltransferase family 39 protein [Oscillospiraceae bacterium]|nr:glycosyltransferase family 39 protein [Oscillospiraceae bacterium]